MSTPLAPAPPPSQPPPPSSSSSSSSSASTVLGCNNCASSTSCPGAAVVGCGVGAASIPSSSSRPQQQQQQQQQQSQLHSNGNNKVNDALAHTRRVRLADGPLPSSSGSSSTAAGAAAAAAAPPPSSQRERHSSNRGSINGNASSSHAQQQQQPQEKAEKPTHHNKHGHHNHPHLHKRDKDGRRIHRRHPHNNNNRRLNLSSTLLAGIAGLWILATTLFLTVPESQGLLCYLHWLRWPLFRDLTDLVSFRLPHARNIRIHTSDGVELGGWHLLPTASQGLAAEASQWEHGSAAREQFFDSSLSKKGTRIVIYFHGNAASRGQFNRLELVKALAATMEAHVVAVDYRGFGDSSGWPSEAGLAEDAKAVYRWVEERVRVGGGGGGGGQGVNVYVYGQSLGSSVALGLAHHLSAISSQQQETKDPTNKTTPTSTPLPLAGLILDAPFTNLTMAALHHPSALPFRILPFVKQALLHCMHEKYPSIDLITTITQPILIIHGRKDRMIPFSLGQELYQAARLARVRTRPALLDDVWFSEVGEGTHHNNYAHPQWTYDLVSFMRTMDGQGAEERGEERGKGRRR